MAISDHAFDSGDLVRRLPTPDYTTIFPERRQQYWQETITNPLREQLSRLERNVSLQMPRCLRPLPDLETAWEDIAPDFVLTPTPPSEACSDEVDEVDDVFSRPSSRRSTGSWGSDLTYYSDTFSELLEKHRRDGSSESPSGSLLKEDKRSKVEDTVLSHNVFEAEDRGSNVQVRTLLYETVNKSSRSSSPSQSLTSATLETTTQKRKLSSAFSGRGCMAELHFSSSPSRRRRKFSNAVSC